MPGFDSTGPLGGGPRTGWGRGPCGQTTITRTSPRSDLLRGVGRGGMPWGGGRGRCFGGRGGMALGWRPFVDEASLSPSEEAEALKAQLAAAENEIRAMKARLEELEKKG